MKIIKIGEKIFTSRNQIEFANISCDFNPIHVNPFLARRLLSGKQIVHGMNLLLTSLNFLFKNKVKFKFNKIQCLFFTPVNINEKISFYKKVEKEKLILEIKSKSTLLSSIILEKKAHEMKSKFFANKKNFKKIEKINVKNVNKDFGKRKFFLKNYEINLNNFKSSKNYNNLTNIFTQNEFKSILSLSYFVGMIAPGHNSILASIDINLERKNLVGNKINLSLKNFDKRINLLTINFFNTISGEIKAFIRQGPTDQPSIKKVKKFIKIKEFSNTRSLIIGGSRGLGELTAKIISCGKGSVDFTYFYGKEEARKLKRIVKLETGREPLIKKFNVLSKNFKQEIKKFSNYDFIFYYSTPKILINKSKKFDNNMYRYYHEFYVKRLKILCETLEKITKKKQVVFFPSTIFIKKYTSGLREYIKAKFIAEKMISKLNSRFSKLKIISNRLPQLNTDQTSDLRINIKNKNIKIIIPLVRSIISQKNAS